MDSEPEAPDLYGLLAVSSTATDAEINKAYKKAALKWHPDRHPPEKKVIATKRFQDIADAFSILSQKLKRHEYDRTYKPGAASSPSPAPPEEPAFSSDNLFSDQSIYTDPEETTSSHFDPQSATRSSRPSHSPAEEPFDSTYKTIPEPYSRPIFMHPSRVHIHSETYSSGRDSAPAHPADREFHTEPTFIRRTAPYSPSGGERYEPLSPPRRPASAAPGPIKHTARSTGHPPQSEVDAYRLFESVMGTATPPPASSKTNGVDSPRSQSRPRARAPEAGSLPNPREATGRVRPSNSTASVKGRGRGAPRTRPPLEGRLGSARSRETTSILPRARPPEISTGLESDLVGFDLRDKNPTTDEGITVVAGEPKARGRGRRLRARARGSGTIVRGRARLSPTEFDDVFGYDRDEFSAHVAGWINHDSPFGNASSPFDTDAGAFAQFDNGFNRKLSLDLDSFFGRS